MTSTPWAARLLGVCALALLLVACQSSSSGTTTASTGDVNHGREVFLSKGCTGCHTMAGIPNAVGTLGPPLTSIGATAGVRRTTEHAEEYLRESIKSPNAYVVPGFQSPSPMPQASRRDTTWMIS